MNLATVPFVLLAPALAAVAAAQDPAPKPPAPAPAPATPAQIERAQKLLAQHGERSRNVRVLVADFVQRRTTALVNEPLVGKGRFLFVREPAAVLFAFTEPRASTVRLTASTYEVHRPHRKQLERFHLDGPELAQGLFAAVGGDVQRLEREFAIASCTDAGKDGAAAVVRLEPKDHAMRERLRELAITLDARDGGLRGVAYRDHAGDWIEIELTAIELDPKTAPAATLDVPKDTTIVEHSPRAKPSPPPAPKK
jgi:hypothetical protein